MYKKTGFLNPTNKGPHAFIIEPSYIKDCHHHEYSCCGFMLHKGKFQLSYSTHTRYLNDGKLECEEGNAGWFGASTITGCGVLAGACKDSGCLASNNTINAFFDHSKCHLFSQCTMLNVVYA